MPQIPKHNLEPLNLGNETIGQRIARLRKGRGLTQSELADKVGISRKLVTDYETGRVRLYDEMVTRFAIALKFSADELLGLRKLEYVESPPSLRLMRRLRQVNELPEIKKKAILKTLDDLIRANS